MRMQKHGRGCPIRPLRQGQITRCEEHDLAWLAQAQAGPAGVARPIHLAGLNRPTAIIATGSAKTERGIGVHGDATEACHGWKSAPDSADRPSASCADLRTPSERLSAAAPGRKSSNGRIAQCA
jgi:hypothetical protein